MAWMDLRQVRGKVPWSCPGRSWWPKSQRCEAYFARCALRYRCRCDLTFILILKYLKKTFFDDFDLICCWWFVLTCAILTRGVLCSMRPDHLRTCDHRRQVSDGDAGDDATKRRRRRKKRGKGKGKGWLGRFTPPLRRKVGKSRWSCNENEDFSAKIQIFYDFLSLVLCDGCFTICVLMKKRCG